MVNDYRSIWYKITPAWCDSDDAGTEVKSLFREGHMIYFKDSDNEVRVLSSMAFCSIYTQDTSKIDPFLPYDYSFTWQLGRPKIDINVAGIPTAHILKPWYKFKKFIRGT